MSPYKWLAVGMRHQSIVKLNNFTFPYSLRHGAYMISCNGGIIPIITFLGTWSNIDEKANG
jgi:hypothetical protein